MKILVVSGTKNEAKEYLEKIGKKGEFVSNYAQLKNSKFIEIHFIGTYYARGDLLVLRQFLLLDWHFKKDKSRQDAVLSKFLSRTSLFQLEEFQKLFPHLYTGDYINIHPWNLTKEQRDTIRFMKPKIFRRYNSSEWIQKVLEKEDFVEKELSYVWFLLTFLQCYWRIFFEKN